jgi:hypothetical protein
VKVREVKGSGGLAREIVIAHLTQYARAAHIELFLIRG